MVVSAQMDLYYHSRRDVSILCCCQEVVGQGYVETNGGPGMSPLINSNHFRLMPNELPELVKRLIVSTQQPNTAARQNRMKAAHYISKRHDEAATEYVDRDEYEDGNDNDDDSFDAANTSSNSADEDQIYIKKRSAGHWNPESGDELQDESQLLEPSLDLSKRSPFVDESFGAEDDERSNLDSLGESDEAASLEKRSFDQSDLIKRKRESGYSVEDKTNDNELEESFRNLKRRENEYESSNIFDQDSSELSGDAE